MIIVVGITCQFPSDHCAGAPGCLLSIDDHDCEVMPKYAEIPVSQGDLSVPVQAAILGHFGQENMEKIFLGMCAPDAQSRIKVGGYNVIDKHYDRLLWSNCAWRAPLEMAGTYHGDHFVARDVALSWLYLHDGEFISSVLDLSPDTLAARVEAASAGARVGISSRARHVIMRAVDESKHAPHYEQRTPLNTLRGPRALSREDDLLTREQVLGTLQTPSKTLIQALEAAAVPDAEWLEAEKQALEVLAALAPLKDWESVGLAKAGSIRATLFPRTTRSVSSAPSPKWRRDAQRLPLRLPLAPLGEGLGSARDSQAYKLIATLDSPLCRITCD